MQINLFQGADISATGMSAERIRMEVVANNIANARTTRSADGGPYRRRHVVFSEALQNPNSTDNKSLSGVKVLGVEADTSDFVRVHEPGHPDADQEGFVLLPNVKMPNEMVDLITASRSYEANLKALTAFREMLEQTLSLLRGNR